MKPCLKLIAVGTLALAAHASAATIVGVDVNSSNTYTGGGVFDTTSRTWTTSATFTLDTSTVTWANPGGNTGTNGSGLFTDYRHSGSSFSLSGLDDSKLYSIVIFSADTASQGATWTPLTGFFNGQTAKVSSGSQMSTLVEGQNYVRFDNIASNGGVISFTESNDGTNPSAAIFNAFEIAVVPEPSAALLGGLGLLGLLRRRRN